jgi:hypothetical protein
MTTLDQELAAAWWTFRPDAAAGSHRFDAGTVEGRSREPSKTHNDQCLVATVPTFPAVLATFDKRHGSAPAEAAEIDPGEWEERAAILEYDGGLDRATAKRLAGVLVRRT